MTFFRRLILVPAAMPIAAHGQSFQSLDAITARAQAVSDAPVRPLDPRIRLAPCPEPLDADPASPTAVTVRCNPLGWRVSVALSQASRATTPVIRRGDPVTIAFAAAGFSITAMGVAESDAALGQPVRARLDAKGAPVMGEARGPGLVRVTD